MNEYVSALTASVDTILLGRRLAQGFIPHWLAHPDMEGAEKVNNAQKVVFTQSLDTSPWKNTRLAKGDLTAEVNELKNGPGGDLIVYGGGAFVSALIEANLIDEYHLFVNPSAIRKGMPIFAGLGTNRSLTLQQAKPFDCGIVALHYWAIKP